MRSATQLRSATKLPAFTVNRRTFLQRTAMGLFGLSLARCGYQEVQPLLSGVELPFLTPLGTHYMKNGAEGSIPGWRTPNLNRDTWSMNIDGLVDTPLTLTYADIEAEADQAIDVLKTMQCVVDSNTAQGLVGTAMWRGVPLRIFLDRAGIQLDQAKRLHFFGADGFTNNLPLHKIYDAAYNDGVPETLVVTHMNGELLERDHGAPVRIIVPDGFGYASVKWVERITATVDESAFGTYQDTGFVDDSQSPVFGKITAPTDNLSVPAGPLTINGFSVSGFGGIDRVDISIDGGPWVPAQIASAAEVLTAAPEVGAAIQFADPTYQYPFRGVWVLWSLSWEATPGRHTIRARATDSTGTAQPERDLEISDGINANASIRVTVG